MKEKEEQLKCTRHEYYDVLEAKLEALHYINMLGLVMKGTEPKTEADSEDSTEELTSQYYLTEKQSKVRPVEGCNYYDMSIGLRNGVMFSFLNYLWWWL